MERILMAKSNSRNISTPLSARLKELRKQLGLKQDDVAQRLGVKRVTIAAYESGRIIPPPGKLRLLARIYDADLQDLISQAELEERGLYIDVSSDLSSEPDQKLLSDFLKAYQQLDSKYQKMVFNVTKALYLG